MSDVKRDEGLCKILHRHHKKRHKQGRGKHKRIFKGPKFVYSINTRPEAVEDKIHFGDWESDTMEGEKSLRGVATHIEKKSCFLVVGKLIDKRSSTCMTTRIKAFKDIDDRLI